jgi:flagellar basal-body rod protein FlgB
MLDGLSSKLEQYLDVLSARQKLVARNIANADTPGYKTQDIDFQSELNRAAGSAPAIIEPGGLPVKNDGNNVSLDHQARLLAENDIRFNIATQLLRGNIHEIREAITEGRTS